MSCKTDETDGKGNDDQNNQIRLKPDYSMLDEITKFYLIVKAVQTCANNNIIIIIKGLFIDGNHFILQ